MFIKTCALLTLVPFLLLAEDVQDPEFKQMNKIGTDAHFIPKVSTVDENLNNDAGFNKKDMDQLTVPKTEGANDAIHMDEVKKPVLR